MSVPNPSEQSKNMGWFDQQFTEIGWPMLVALSVLLTALMWIFSGLGFLLTRNPVAHRKARIIFIICTVIIVGAVVLVLSQHGPM